MSLGVLQISFKLRERLGRVRIPCTVEEGKRKEQKDLPLLTGIRLLCLYSEYLVAAAKGNKETSLVVYLFSADLLDPLLELISAFSYKLQQSDGELPKNLPIVKALNSLFEILAMMEQLLLGNIYKWLALHIDDIYANTINRLFDNGTLFPSVTDPSDRDILRRNENIHYVGFAAKILIRYVVDELPLCKSSKKRSPTIFEVLSSTWTALEVV
ncbi:hypothetical protein C8A03DRAFT_45169 [Achaetomium macrosporum]|uniref:Uncharacterized protein n=1 Tax=Achaetomium macrosporum TaxID=79813 RepID=A0AAN7C7X4_9PEZI|nr:hypothetical protein C8A03DRAFT_45169 [Achaetomium macrosporum]